jgi:hypothetical protein
MPWWEWKADYGFAPRNPDESTVMIARRQVFKRRPQNECNYMPRICVDPVTNQCGPDGLCDSSDVENVSQSLTDLSGETNGNERVRCTSYACGDASIANIKIMHKDKRAGFTMDYDCGVDLKAILKDGNEVTVRIIDNSLANPSNIYTVQRVDSSGDPADFDDATCIETLVRFDADPAEAVILGIKDSDSPGCGEFAAGEIEIVTDSILSCGVGDDVEVDYVSAAGAVITTGDGVISSADHARSTYVIALTPNTLGATDASGNEAQVVRCV